MAKWYRCITLSFGTDRLVLHGVKIRHYSFVPIGRFLHLSNGNRVQRQVFRHIWQFGMMFCLYSSSRKRGGVFILEHNGASGGPRTRISFALAITDEHVWIYRNRNVSSFSICYKRLIKRWLTLIKLILFITRRYLARAEYSGSLFLLEMCFR